jgi:hypothetical protein
VGRRSALAGDSLTTSAFGSRIGLGSLPSDREPATMSLATVALDIDKATHVHLVFTSKITFDRDTCTVDTVPDARQVLVAQVPHSGA